MSRRATVLASIGFLLVALGIAAAVIVKQQEDAAKAHEARVAHEREEHEREQRAIALVARLEEESRTMMPEALSGVALGMPEGDLRIARRGLVPSRNAGDREHLFLEEDLANGAQILYGVDRRAHRLTQVQILSLLPGPEAITPHLTSMHETYGSPTGVWDCPDTEGVPTRRFTWRRSLTTVMDVFLVYRGRVSLTLYVAPSEVIQRSLAMAHCHAVSQADLEQFPVATEEQMRPPQPPGGAQPGSPQPQPQPQ